MITVAFVVAAAIGALLRAWVTDVDADFTRQMYGTAAVNILGSFLLGLIAEGPSNTLLIVGMGGLGTFTTFSTYVSQIECISREGQIRDAVLYAAGSLVAGIGAAYVGLRL